MLKPYLCLICSWPLRVSGDGVITETTTTIPTATTATPMGFEPVGSGFCMDSQGNYYDTFGACEGEVVDFDGTIQSCEDRAASNVHAVGFAYASSDQTGLARIACCDVYMENGFVPTEFQYTASRSATSNEGAGRTL